MIIVIRHLSLYYVLKRGAPLSYITNCKSTYNDSIIPSPICIFSYKYLDIHGLCQIYEL